MKLAAHLTELRERPEHFLDMSGEELFAIGAPELEEIHLSILQRRFRELRPKVKVLDRLAAEVHISEISVIEDIAPLGLPHTMYKSYSAADAQNGRYDRLTTWLSTLCAFDLNSLDVRECDSMESWLAHIETRTPMRPTASSGTGGKISITPRGLPEEIAQWNMLLHFFDPYRDEHGVDIRSGEVPFLCPWPSDSGRQAFINTVKVMRDRTYKGRENLVHTVGKGWISADELQLASKLRKAESLGEELLLMEREKQVAALVAERNRALPDRLNAFVENVVRKLAGQKVVMFGFWTQIFELAVACRDRGIKADWAPDSLIVTGGGTKGFTFPDGWRGVIDEVFPYHLRQVYGMSESTASAIGCSQGRMHPLPWGVKLVLDPATSECKPRSGLQTGRLLVHDLLSTSLWPTTLTGDLVTINFDGGCACGRKGPYFHNTIGRLSEALGGDDKITCAKTPQAYENLEKFALSSGI